MPLFTLDGSLKTSVPRKRMAFFKTYLDELGKTRTAEVRSFIDCEIDKLPRDERNLRNFSSSHLGSRLSPWPQPLSHLYSVSWELIGDEADEKFIQDQAALIFGLFVWECMVKRREIWVFYDPNLSAHDTNQEFMGKVYFERG